MTEESAKEKLESFDQAKEKAGTGQAKEEFVNLEELNRKDSFIEGLEDSNTTESEGVIINTDSSEGEMKDTDQAETEKDVNNSNKKDVNPKTVEQKVSNELEEEIPDIDDIDQVKIDSSIKDEAAMVRSDKSMEVPTDSEEDQKQKNTDTDDKEIEAENNKPDTTVNTDTEGLLKRCSGVGSVAASVLLTQFV